MGSGARTPDELETLLEDAFVVRDAVAVACLYEESAVLGRPGRRDARGRAEIAAAAADAWTRGLAFVAAPQQILQTRETALVVGPYGVSVAHRDRDGAWRYAISLLDIG